MMGENIIWSPGVTLEQIEKQVILKAFRFYRSNKTATSRSLGIAIRTLDNKLERYQLEEQEQEKANEYRSAERTRFLERSRGSVQINPETGSSVLSPTAEVRVESASTTQAEHEMPMPKRREVQTMLPGQAPKNGAGKSR